MRLTCPRCGAQYEIPDSAIPATGREVECSACSEVWHQPGAAEAVEATPPAQPEGDYDASDRPALHRPLHESILSVLREETARELSARKGTPPDRAEAGGQIDAIPEAIQAKEAAPAPVEIRWPVATVILPGEPLKPGDESAGEEPNRAEPPQPEPQAEPRLPDAARLAATLLRRPQSETLDTETDHEDEASGPAVTAGMLQRPDRKEAAPPAAVAAKQTEGALVVSTAAKLPAPPAAARSRPGYAAGFGLAVLLAAALIAFYLMAPRVPPEGEASTVAEWRAGLDRGRLWLADRAGALWTGIAGE